MADGVSQGPGDGAEAGGARARGKGQGEYTVPTLGESSTLPLVGIAQPDWCNARALPCLLVLCRAIRRSGGLYSVNTHGAGDGRRVSIFRTASADRRPSPPGVAPPSGDGPASVDKTRCQMSIGVDGLSGGSRKVSPFWIISYLRRDCLICQSPSKTIDSSRSAADNPISSSTMCGRSTDAVTLSRVAASAHYPFPLLHSSLSLLNFRRR